LKPLETLDAFDLEILRAAQAHGLRRYRRGWSARYSERHFPSDRINALAATSFGYVETDDIGPVFGITKTGRRAVAADDARQLDDSLVTEAQPLIDDFMHGRLS
jgi:hypothetical protein